MSKNIVADFETTTDPNDCRVWGWGAYDIDKNEFKHGTIIETFFEYVYTLPNKSKIYFHNLKFDGEFIMYYLFIHNYKWVENIGRYNMEFTTLITDMNIFYSIKIKYGGKEYEFLDSLKIIPLPVSKISKAFNLEQKKGEIDYNKPRHRFYEPTKEEIEYIKNDVEIVGKAIKYFFSQKLNHMTQASNAFYDYKNIISAKRFSELFPAYIEDAEIRLSYKGGFTYLNPKFKNKVIYKGIVLDVNSLYPAVMYNDFLPFGEPIKYKGKYVEDAIYNLYVQVLVCHFEVKEGFLPTLQLKNNLSFVPTEYVTSSNGEDIVLCLTSVDLKLFLEHYNVYNIEWVEGWKFKSTNTLFKEYIDKWVEVKNTATIEKNNGMRTLAKLMLNSLYGKFGLNPLVKNKIPYYENEYVVYRDDEPKERDPVYIPIATFITAYARYRTITSAQANYKRFIYADTDSLHLVGTKCPDNIPISFINLGEWKIEYEFTRGKYLRAKSYIEETTEGHLHVACAGLPSRCHDQVNFENFKSGTVIHGKLQHKRVKNGVILKEVDFTIKV